MGLHREGNLIIPVSLLILGGLWTGLYFLFAALGLPWIAWILAVPGLIFFGLIVNFFRNPAVTPTITERGIVAPCDGKVVVIEEVYDPIFFKAQVRQISIFMSPLNVHVNRNPIAGKLVFHKYFPGKYLVAWHPKSSTENEQTYFAVQNAHMTVGFKQIAGAVARRIRWYVKEGDTVQQGAEMGFIRFGSRMDILIPLEAEVKVNLEQLTKAGVTLLAELP